MIMEKAKVHAVLLAGGTGTRFGADIPKQFVEVNGMPIVVHTLKKLQIDTVTDITVVCVRDWIPVMEDLVRQYRIGKIRKIIPGGSSAFDSIRKGYETFSADTDDNEIILVHDAVRPLLPAELIEDAVEKAVAHGNGMACMKNIEGLVLKDDDHCGVLPVDRYRVMRVQTPQAFKCGLLHDLMDRASKEEACNFPYTESLCIKYGVPIYFSKSFPGNTKITTKPDIAFMKAMMQFTDEELMGNIT